MEDEQHPLTALACRLLTQVDGGEWVFDDPALQAIEECLLGFSGHPSLPQAVIELFHLGTELQASHGSLDASGALFALLGHVGPRLQGLMSFEELREVAVQNAKKLTGTPERALPRNSPVPEGSLRIGDIQQRGGLPHFK